MIPVNEILEKISNMGFALETANACFQMSFADLDTPCHLKGNFKLVVLYKEPF
jgi:hypothetical protein